MIICYILKELYKKDKIMNTLKRFNIKKYDAALPLVSVVIPCFNYGKYIEETIQSVRKQTLQRIEIIVVDDGSTDPLTKKVLKKLEIQKDLSVIYQENMKTAAARNNGIKASHGKYICCLDADDLLEPTYIEKCVTKMEIENLDVCGSWIRLFGNSKDLWITHDLDIEEIINENRGLGSSLFRKEIWEKVGGYKNIGYEDWEFWISVAEFGGRGRMVEEPLFLYRRHENSKSQRDYLDNMETIEKIHSLHPNLYNGKTNIQKIREIELKEYMANNPFENIQYYTDNTESVVSRHIESLRLEYLNLREERFEPYKDTFPHNDKIIDLMKTIYRKIRSILKK